GLLSPVCGCAVAAGAGSAAGLTILREGDISAVENAASAVLATLTGMLCDGGKVGCALKVWTAVSTAEESAYLALKGVSIPSGNGIVGPTIDDTLAALERVAKEGLSHLDRVLVDAIG
ncbi:MAG: L-serine ammonia-lyase, iron-sulfur-dependent, subunit alpha, partial [Bacillota bacterium]